MPDKEQKENNKYFILIFFFLNFQLILTLTGTINFKLYELKEINFIECKQINREKKRKKHKIYNWKSQ